MSLLHEIRRRHVLRVAVAYLAGSWLLIQVLETLFPIFGIAETSIRVVVIVLAIGLVPALILSWVFEWTPQGLQRDRNVSPDASTRVGTSRTLDRVIIVTLTIALGYFALDKFVIAPGRDSYTLDPAAEVAKRYATLNPLNDMSIAVLPFTNMSGDPQQQYFADGLSEELLNSLVRIKDLRVISRTSSFAFRDRNLPIAEIAAVLGVGHILEGSVRRSRDQVRITAQLIDTTTDAHLWSETFDRNLSVDNVLSIQAEIATMVASALQLKLSPQATESFGTRGPANLVALDLYLDGLHYSNLLDPYRDGVERNMGKAIEKLQAAITADPDWAPPRVELAVVYAVTKHQGNKGERLRVAMGHVMDALRIDPDYPGAHKMHAYLLVAEGNYEGGMLEYNRAQELGDNIHWGKAILLRILARHSEAIDEFHAAAATDPMGPGGMAQLYETYYCAGRYAEAIDGLTEFFADELQAERNPYLTMLVANAYARAGDMETALRLAEGFVAFTGNAAPVASVFVLAGQTERARRALETTDETAPFVLVDIAPAAILLGDQDRAIDMLEQAADAVWSNVGLRYDWLWRLRCAPEIQSLAGNPRYEALLDRLGLPE